MLDRRNFLKMSGSFLGTLAATLYLPKEVAAKVSERLTFGGSSDKLKVQFSKGEISEEMKSWKSFPDHLTKPRHGQLPTDPRHAHARAGAEALAKRIDRGVLKTLVFS